MARLQFDLKPLGPWRGKTIEEHNAEALERAKIWDWMHPAPCGCGYFIDGMLCSCRVEERERKTPEQTQNLLRWHYEQEHKKNLRKKRQFPDLPSCPLGTCYWCREPIVHGRAKQRSMHDGRLDEPNCSREYALRTDAGVQQGFLLRRDGYGCADCKALRGGYVAIWTDQTDERVAETWASREWIRKRFEECPAGPLTYLSWSSPLEVDHVIPLAAAWEAFGDNPDRLRWFFGPPNLRLRCGDCHKAKTRQDVAFIRACQKYGAAWAKTEILRRLADAGLLRVTGGRK